MYVSIKVKADSTNLEEYTLDTEEFDIHKFKDRMDIYFKEAVIAVVRNHKQGNFLFIDPNFYETKPISCLHLHWRGINYKDMKIKIDIVPAFKIENYNPLFIYTAEPCEYYAFCKTGFVRGESTIYPVAYSDVELKLIAQLPESARNGLKLAKGMRIAALFPAEILQILREVFSIEDCLKTYILKTSLFYYIKGSEMDSRQLSTEEWAYLIYLHLEIRLMATGKLPSLFTIPYGPSRDPLLFGCMDSLNTDVGHERQCCVNRKNLLLITHYLRVVLEVYLRENGYSHYKLTPLIAMATKAAKSDPLTLYSPGSPPISLRQSITIDSDTVKIRIS